MSQDLTAMKILLLVATQATEGKHSHKVRIKVAMQSYSYEPNKVS